MISVQYLEQLFGRPLTPDEVARIEERDRRRHEIHAAIDKGDLVEAARLLDILKGELGDLNSDVVYAETSLEWAQVNDDLNKGLEREMEVSDEP